MSHHSLKPAPIGTHTSAALQPSIVGAGLCARPPQKFDRGVTLVEILISLTILVLVTAALSSGTNYLTRRLVRAKNATIARNLAWKKLAEIKARRIEKGQRSGIFGREFPGFSYSEKIEFAKVGNVRLPALFNYELIVTWPEAWQEDRVTFTTLIADYLQGPAKIASETPGASP